MQCTVMASMSPPNEVGLAALRYQRPNTPLGAAFGAAVWTPKPTLAHVPLPRGERLARDRKAICREVFVLPLMVASPQREGRAVVLMWCTACVSHFRGAGVGSPPPPDR